MVMLKRSVAFSIRARVAAQVRVVLFALLFVVGGGAGAAQPPSGAAIASAHPLATAAGYEILRAGGNAFDAAVAVAAALAVVEPYSSGLGGGGFWLLHRARDGSEVMLDARETAPAKAALSQYLDAAGNPLRGATLRGGTAAGIPGVPAGLDALARNYGSLPLAQLLAPAIALARDGFRVDERFASVAKLSERVLKGSASTARIFLDGGAAPQAGFLLRQSELAATLEALARAGRDGFYRGRVGASLIAAANAAGAVWQNSDLENYRVMERASIRFTYRGATIVSAPLPSSGGVILAEAINILEQFHLGDVREPASAHLVIEALRRGFQDRALYLGDPDFVKAPVARLISKDYARRRAATIDPKSATLSSALVPAAAPVEEGNNTTHYSVIDADGNRVGATLSINTLFGSGIVAGDTGVLFNNEMDDFSLQATVPNNYRLLGSQANALALGKRPLSSMTPTFVEDGKGVLIIGAPGGPRIVSQVLLGILDYVAGSTVDLDRIVSAPRYHHQYLPDRIEIEPQAFTPEWARALEARGHKLQTANRKWGNMQAVFKSKADGAARAASDPRGSDVAWY